CARPPYWGDPGDVW
nr:immunoglobulin heavy chain junction region [Macaca mulatta]MOX67563.1 immunoglobulin heavy chain junction region [Macaca mulatta]